MLLSESGVFIWPTVLQVFRRSKQMFSSLLLSIAFLLSFNLLTENQAISFNAEPPEEVSLFLDNPVLSGKANLSAFIFDIYDAELWVEKKPWDFNQAFSLSIKYNRSISKEKFVSSSIEELERYYDIIRDKRIYIEILNSILPSVQEGDRISAVFQPGIGLVFFYNGQEIGVIHDLDFAKKYIMIWLHPKAYYADVRKGLLGLIE